MYSLSFRQRFKYKKVKLKTNNRLLNAKIVGDLDVELAMGNLYLNGIKFHYQKN